MKASTSVKTHNEKTFHAIRKSGSGYEVIAKSTGKPLSNHPMSHAKSLAQLGAIEGHKHHEPGY